MGHFIEIKKTSLISLLLKKGKDPLDCSSYRPISLIPCDLKIYAKVFASRLEKVIHSLIKEDQNWFHQGAQCIWQYASTPSYSWLCGLPPNALCGLFTWCRKSLWQARVELYVGSSAMFRLGEHFVSMIKTLYHSPAASVITGNIISPSFPLQRGTRQGCPLSPLLFLSISRTLSTSHQEIWSIN